MSEAVPSPAAPPARNAERIAARLKARHRAEARFRALGLGAVVLSALVLALLLFTMTSNGLGGFTRNELRFPIDLTTGVLNIQSAQIEGTDAVQALDTAALKDVVELSAEKALGEQASGELATTAWREVAQQIIADPTLLSRRFDVSVPVSDAMAKALRGEGDPQLGLLARKLKQEGKLHRALDIGFLTRSDATSPQQVGIWGALKGSILTMLVTLGVAFPVGVAAAVYLEEYAPKNRWTDLIEVSINNLAAVPSIIFGLLGLAVFLWIFPYYRSAPLIGGLTLALMTMPVIVISGRNAIKAVPPSIRDGALAIGASPIQVVFHHVLPLALPGILTGTIIGMARALGETAPLLMIGMRAFVATPPGSFTEPATALPVQIYLWSDEIDRGFVERTSAAIIVLLIFLLVMNGLAIYLRNRFEKTW
ncbi:MAG: phosphate ABC transporter permease PstA [Candidatus Andeanibacterium colombiense]|uniref:Phosphate transport system permease protein PstA n=1 Tax=Candidatus Andeanibacterium colombiense TaxID=3121345 RepID=A0AAJ5XAH7_9SPHN|nr:MAG: phosphate ABC transporter permease PstA [Sphingomonadaceae bacterium]